MSIKITFLLTTSFMLCSSLYANWAEQTLAKLSREEKIAQLFMVAVHPDTKNGVAKTIKTISDHLVGGIIFFEGDPEQQVLLTNQLQKLSPLPLLVGQDCEWGLSQRLRNTISFPKNFTLGAIQEDNLIYELGKEIGRQCQLVGVHINFAPVVDINTNPLNPVIGMRSFGTSKEHVTQKAIAYLDGLTDAGIIGCAKHFPGHGDTTTDSHYELPIVLHTQERIFHEELYPFSFLITAGIPAIMTGHLHIPAFDSTPNLPATFSSKIITDLLKNNLSFQGLMITDSLVMHAITKHWPAGQAEYMALLAGNDILLCPRDVPKAITRISQALDSGELSQESLNEHVLKILQTKHMLCLHKHRFIEEQNITKKLHTKYAQELRTKLYRAAITLVRNTANTIPLNPQTYENKNTDNSIAILQIGGTQQEQNNLKNFYISPEASNQEITDILKNIEQYTTLIIGICKLTALKNNQPKRNNTPPISEPVQKLLEILRQKNKKFIYALFTSPYNLVHVAQDNTVIVSYENTPDTWQATLDVIFGKTRAPGKLPIKIHNLLTN